MTLRKGFGAELALPHANDLRLDMAGMVVRNAAGVPRGGIFPPAATNLLSATASMNVAVAAFSGVAVRDGGVVFLANDGPVNVLLPNPPSSNSALHVVWAKQNDSSSYVTTPDSDNNAVFGVLAGASAPIPVRNPAGLPAGAIELGTVLVPSTATNTGSAGVIFTPTYLYTAMAGGIVQFRTKAELDQWTTAIPNQRASVAATGYEYSFIGTTWVQRLVARHAGNPGAAISGIAVPAGALDLPSGVMIQTGQLVAATSIAFGNEYFPVVNFPTPFPNYVLSLTLMPLSGSPITAAASPLALDTLNATQFRAMVPGSGNPWIRGFVWTAIGG